MPRRNPTTPRHSKAAVEKLSSAKGLYQAVRDAGKGEPGPRQEVLLHAHMTASQAIQEAANAKAYRTRDEAYRLLQQIESHLSQLRRPGKTNPIENPGMRRYPDLAAAKRAAQREATRRGYPHYVYEVKTNPRFTCLPASHPIQVSIEKGTIGVAPGQLRYTAEPPQENPGREDRDEVMLDFPHERGWLYHVTLGWRLPAIRKDGLDPGAQEGMGVDGYEEHSSGGLFLTDSPGVPYWLAMAYGGAWVHAEKGQKVGRRILLRVPKRKCPIDRHGSRDATVWTGEKSRSYRCTSAIAPGEIEVWDTGTRRWRSLPAKNPRRRQKPKPKPGANPYETKDRAKPGGLGFHGGDYKYKGFRYKVQEESPGRWGVRWTDIPGDAAEMIENWGGTGANDAHSAADMAKATVDRYLYASGLEADDRESFENVEIMMVEFLDGQNDSQVTRSDLARILEVARKAALGRWDAECSQADRQNTGRCIGLSRRLEAMRFFSSLPLGDRMRWLDTAVKRERIERGLPLDNPAKKRKKAKRNPERSAFRRLMRL